MLLLALSRLEVPDLCRCSCVSRYWRRVCGCKTLWTQLDLSLIVWQRVTHSRLLNLVARAQGGLRSLIVVLADQLLLVWTRSCPKARWPLSSNSRQIWRIYWASRG